MKNFILLFVAMGLLVSCGKSSSNQSGVPAQASPEVRPGPAPSRPPEVDPVKVDEYLMLVNNHRAKLGLRPVEASPIIEEVSFRHSKDMAEGRKYWHNGWRKRCQELRDRLKGNLCGEILAQGQKTPQDVFQAWLNSPSHRQVIEGPTYTHTGLGFVTGRYGRIYWTQLFLEIE